MTHQVPGPSGHVTTRAPSRRESRLAPCARLRRCLPALDGRVRSGGVIGRLGSGARAQRTAVTQCGTSLPNFPNLPGPEATVFLLIFLLGVVSSPPPARQVTAFPESGGWGRWGRGPGGLPGTVPLRAGQQGVPASGRAETPGRRRSVRGRRGCHAGERVASHGRRAGKREPVTACSGPRGGSVPGLAVLPGTGVGVALGGAEERAVVRECRLLTFPLPARSAADSGEAGPGAPLGAISSLGLSRPAT